MRPALLLLLAGLVLAAAAPAAGQQPDEPYAPTGVEVALLAERARNLGGRIDTLRRQGAPDHLLVEIEIFHKAVAWLLRYPEEFHRKIYVHDALNAAAEGETRAQALARGEAPWREARGRVVRAYRSRVDGSVQPYIVHVPAGYDGSRPVRLDVVLHGRNARLNELSFLTSAARPRAGTPEPAYLALEVYGRTNNAYRWAGETDVFEAFEAVRRDFTVDENRVVLRGFSMGGAGTWNIGLRRPDRWVAIEAGAGFTDTLVYAEKSLPSPLPAWHRAAMGYYDAVAYAANARLLPTVGYGGEDDPQLQAAANIRLALERDGAVLQPDGLDFVTDSLRALFLVGPKTGHRFHADSKRRSDEFLDEAVARGRSTPRRVRFVTRTTAAPEAWWARIDGLERHYDAAEIDVERTGAEIRATTRNASRLVFADAGSVERVLIDGKSVDVPPQHGSRIFLRRESREWRLAPSLAAARGDGLVKNPGLQGPIDDAFVSRFLVVEPTGEPWHAAAGRTAAARLERFRREFPKWLRADIPVKKDTEVSEADIAGANLILFGDPGSNALLALLAERLPIEWTRESFRLGGKSYRSAERLPVLIYPNPLNPERYVVVNSGHTFGEAEFRGTNALLYPRLGDWAALDAATDEPVAAGYFDERWRP